MSDIKNLISSLLSAIYPQKCICCSQIISEEEFLCSYCKTIIEHNNLDNLCLECGFEKDECVCKYNIYRFSALICVFKNVGHIKKVYYSYKFARKQHYSDFFAIAMSDAVLKCYNDVSFDCICSVPSAARFGYDHSGYIAKKISEILNIPYIDNLLSCKKRTKKQHKSNIKERMQNVEGKYRYNKTVEGARVLLVDDIKTTGATLDECAKMILFAGATSVHCVTALGSHTNKN